jgi:hypothetical protein
MKKQIAVVMGSLLVVFMVGLFLFSCTGTVATLDDGGDDGVDADGGGNTDDGGTPTDDGGNPTDDGGNPTDDGGNPTDDGGGTDDGGNPTDDGGSQTDCGDPQGEVFGAEPNPTCNPIGGGPGYNRIISEADNSVTCFASTKQELIDCLGNANPRDVVFVRRNADIDMTGTPTVTIKGQVTLASDRGLNGSPGGLIKRKENLNGGWEEPMFKTSGANVRVTGLQIEGEMLPQDSTGEGESRYLVGLEAESATNFEVDNCELRGWQWAAVSLDRSTGSYIHHNYIHSNQGKGEGYGTCHYGGDAIVEANMYNYNRHDVTGAGWTGEKYEFRYNINLGYGTAAGGSRIDVHSDENGGHFAGDAYHIHHNTFHDNGAGVQRMLPIEISEKPTTGAYIYNNNFEGESIAGGYYTVPIRQMAFSTFGNMFVTNNYWADQIVPDDSIVMYELR